MKKSPVLSALLVFFGTLLALGIGTGMGWYMRGQQDTERYGIFLKSYATDAEASEVWKAWALEQGDGEFGSEITQLNSGAWVITNIEERRD